MSAFQYYLMYEILYLGSKKLVITKMKGKQLNVPTVSFIMEVV